jgi:cytochrome b6-f complex iron-sulfur subunit
MDQPAPSRRTVLTGAGIVVGGLAGSSLLAACGSSGSSGTAAPAATGGSTGSAGSTGSGGSAGIAALSSIPDGSTVAVENPQGGSLLLTRNGNAVTGLSAKCTHQGCTVAPKGNVIVCPCHGSEFQPGTGAVLNGPALEPLPKIAVAVTNGQVTLA